MVPGPDPKVEVSVTPNPNAMKFVVDRKVVADGSRSYTTKFEALDDPLAEAIFGVPGVQSLFYMADFITVTKEPGATWETIVPAVTDAIRQHLPRG